MNTTTGPWRGMMRAPLYTHDWQMVQRLSHAVGVSTETIEDLLTILKDEQIILVDTDDMPETDDYKRGWNDACDEIENDLDWHISGFISDMKYRGLKVIDKAKAKV